MLLLKKTKTGAILMKISKIMKQLEKMQKEHGDIDVYISDHTAPFDREIEVDFREEEGELRKDNIIFYK